MEREVPKERVLLYCRALSDIGETQLRFAFDRALGNLGEFLPSIETLRAYANEWYEMARERQAKEHMRALLDRPSIHPDFADKSKAERRREFQRIVLESKASGAWGPDAIEPAKRGLAVMDQGDDVNVPGSLNEAIEETYGSPNWRRR